MIRKRAVAAGIAEEIGCHTFRATGITAYLANGGALEHAQEMAAHESPRTTKLYDQRKNGSRRTRSSEFGSRSRQGQRCYRRRDHFGSDCPQEEISSSY